MDFSEKAIETFLLTIYKKKFVVEKVDDLFECLELANFLGNENFENECLEYFTLEFIKEKDERKKAMKVLLSLEIQNEKVNNRIAELASGKNDNIFNLYDEMGNVTGKMNFYVSVSSQQLINLEQNKIFIELGKKAITKKTKIFMIPTCGSKISHSPWHIYFHPYEEKEMIKKYPCLKNIYKKIFIEDSKNKNIYFIHDYSLFNKDGRFFNANISISNLLRFFEDINSKQFFDNPLCLQQTSC